MTLTEILDAIYDLTERPDLDKMTLMAVQEATSTVHNVQDWWKDIQTVLISFDTPTQYVQIVDTQNLPRFKSMAFIRKSSSQTGPVQQYGLPWPASANSFPSSNFNFLKRIEIDDVLDPYGYEKADVWYGAGAQVNIKSSTALAQALCGFYQRPLIGSTDDRYISWIADELPWIIIYRAAGTVFAHTGDDKNYNLYMRPPIPGRDLDTGGMYWQQLDILQQGNLLAGS